VTSTPDAGVTGQPPAMTGPPTTSTQTHNFAIHHLYLGDDDPNPAYTADPNAWKSIGYDLDGKVTTASSRDVCTPYTRGQTAQQIDGVDGIDNAFGDIIVAALSQLGVNLSQTNSEKIIAGEFTTEIDTTGLDDTNPTASAIDLGGQLFAGTAYPGGTPPSTGSYFSISDSWPVDGTGLNGGTIASGSKIVFPGAYVTSGTWVSGAPVTLGLNMSIGIATTVITIHDAVITFNYTVAAGQGLAGRGIIAGVLDTAEFIKAVNAAIGSFDNGAYCSLLQSVFIPTIEGAQDIILDPSTGSVSNTAGTPCNAISIGLAFDADEIQPPSQVGAVVDAGAAMPCPGDAG
jgi:hypothetical protein